MKTAIISLTRNGGKTAAKVQQAIGGDLYCKIPPETFPNTRFNVPLKILMTELFSRYDRFVMIMAAGIVVRTVAPLIVKKDRDPAVVVMDEKGKFAISLLSGHLGGANELAEELERTTGTTAVVTTATDINQMVAFDMVAKENNCTIENLHCLAAVSGALVNGGKVRLYCPYPIQGTLPSNIILEEHPDKCDVIISPRRQSDSREILTLRPRNLILGAGCRKGKPYEDIAPAFQKFVKEHDFAPTAIAAIASIDLKAEEEGLIQLGKDLGVPFVTYSAKELEPFDTTEGGSAFVKEITGVHSVSVSAALCRSQGGKLWISKTKYNGITFSLAECPTEIRL